MSSIFWLKMNVKITFTLEFICKRYFYNRIDKKNTSKRRVREIHYYTLDLEDIFGEDIFYLTKQLFIEKL